LSKLYFKKNGKGYITSATLSVPLLIARDFEGMELEVKKIDNKIVIEKKKDK